MATKSGHIGMRIQDASGEVTSMPLYIHIDDTQTLATIVTAAVAAVDLVGNVIVGQIDKAFLVVDVSGFTVTSPVALSRIENTGLLRCQYPDGSPRHWGLDIPAFNNAKLSTGTKNINMADTNVANLVAEIEGGGFVYTTPSGNVIDEVLDGRQTFRKHRRIANRH